ncbi:MAG: cupin domain-containing protein [Chloroflexi bacterium]|nr:cupin domain-containing protein [Chloroflexota bacterium]
MQRVKESELMFRGGKSGVKYLMRGPRIDWGVILLLPGERLSGHYHNEVEETFYIVEGEGTIIVNGEEHAVAAGDVLRMETRDRHELRNSGSTNLKLVFIKCPYLPEDKVDI